jgi:hypothetical protein
LLGTPIEEMPQTREYVARAVPGGALRGSG